MHPSTLRIAVKTKTKDLVLKDHGIALECSKLFGIRAQAVQRSEQDEDRQ